jgi:hypothetical protein
MPRKEKHWGTVTDNQDPEKRGRLIVEVPTIAEGDVLEWIEPSFHFVDSSAEAGCFWVPNVGSTVEVEIEAEEDSEVTDLEAKWMCSVYPDGTVPAEFEQNYPERRGWKTKAGHLLYFDDTANSREFYYEHPSGTKIVVTNTGEIQLTPVAGQSVLIGETADQHLVRGEKLTTWAGSIIGGGFLGWAASHIHPDPVSGNTGAPVSLPGDFPADLLSDDHKVK